MQYSSHALLRINCRLAGYVTKSDVDNAIRGRSFTVGETHVLVKTLPQRVYIQDGDKILKGDQIWAVVRRSSKADTGAVATVMVRGSTQPARGNRRYS